MKKILITPRSFAKTDDAPKKLLQDAKVCVSPGIGFGDYGDTHVRFALIENRDRIRQAVRGIKAMFRADGLLPSEQKSAG